METGFLVTEFLDNALWRWIVAPLLVIILILLLRMARDAAAKRLGTMAARTAATVDDLIASLVQDTRSLLIFFVSLALASRLLDFGENFAQVMKTIAIAAIFIQLAIWTNSILLYLLQAYFDRRGGDHLSGRAAISTLGFLIKAIVWSIAILLILDNLPGVEVNSLIASLGIAGVAGALAVQNILGDLFASLSIIFDHPFNVGDSIAFDGLSGTVERIGLKSTRIRSIFGEELIVSNSDLLKSQIHNYRDIGERRLVFDVAIASDTPLEQVERVSGMLEEIATSAEDVRFSRATLREFGDGALIYEVETFVTKPDYKIFMKAREAIHLEILRRFRDEGIALPSPALMGWNRDNGS